MSQNFKVLIILPNWLGDAVMATPAIEAIVNEKPDVEITFIGSFVSIEAMKHHPNCKKAIIDETKKASSRLLATYTLAKEIGYHDVAINFRNQIHSALLIYWSGTKKSVARKSWFASLFLEKSMSVSSDIHLVKQYFNFIKHHFYCSEIVNLKLHIPQLKSEKKLLGINPGATYGSAKRWYPQKFAEVAQAFSHEYDIVIFGGPTEVEMAEEIVIELKKMNISNYENLAGKTTITELISNISSLSLFITNDSGPMHVAAAYQIPTVSIFGPTRHHETSQWQNRKSSIVRLENLECSPCMKRECPLSTDNHKCMKDISAEMVITAIKELKL
jgi:heptosyltransferase II